MKWKVLLNWGSFLLRTHIFKENCMFKTDFEAYQWQIGAYLKTDLSDAKGIQFL